MAEQALLGDPLKVGGEQGAGFLSCYLLFPLENGRQEVKGSGTACRVTAQASASWEWWQQTTRPERRVNRCQLKTESGGSWGKGAMGTPTPGGSVF